MKTSICICTHQRNELLERLLRSLATIKLDGPLTGVDIDVLVIDNACSAATVELCETVGSDLRFPLRYFAEPQRGISQARNRAVAEALLDGADLIAFIDDDDQPRANWLQALVSKHLHTSADIVFGCWVFGPEVPGWARDSSLFKSLLKPGDRTARRPVITACRGWHLRATCSLGERFWRKSAAMARCLGNSLATVAVRIRTSLSVRCRRERNWRRKKIPLLFAITSPVDLPCWAYCSAVSKTAVRG